MFNGLVDNRFNNKEKKSAEANKVSPMPGQVLQTVVNMDSYDASIGRYDTARLDEAQVITSRIVGTVPEAFPFDIREERHKVVLDIDMPAKLIPSSTPGHSHLYIDHAMSDRQWRVLIEALAYAGIIEPGYANASLQRGFTAVRLPWVKKGQNDTPRSNV